MNICDSDHEEVCYEGRKCPCCELVQQVKELEKENADLKESNNEK